MSFREEVITFLCDQVVYIKAMATLMIFFGVLSTLSLVLGEPGTGPYALAIVNFTLAVLSVVGLSGIFWYCKHKHHSY